MAHVLLCFGKLARAACDGGSNVLIGTPVIAAVVERACELVRSGQLSSWDAANGFFWLSELRWPLHHDQVKQLLAAFLAGQDQCEALTLSQVVLAWGRYEEQLAANWDPTRRNMSSGEQRALGEVALDRLPAPTVSCYPGAAAMEQIEQWFMELKGQADEQTFANALQGMALLRHLPSSEFWERFFAGECFAASERLSAVLSWVNQMAGILCSECSSVVCPDGMLEGQVHPAIIRPHRACPDHTCGIPPVAWLQWKAPGSGAS